MEDHSLKKMTIEQHLYNWKGNEKLQGIDKTLDVLFQEYFNTNTFFEHILIKVCTLNSLYSTQIFDTYSVAKHIYELEVDEDLLTGDLSLVNRIAKCEISGKSKNFYSFASKYCAHHKPETYSIYDSFVEKALFTFNENDPFDTFKKPELRDYPTFMRVMDNFIQKNHLHEYSLAEVDKYLWLAGKEFKSKGNEKRIRTKAR